MVVMEDFFHYYVFDDALAKEKTTLKIKTEY